MRIGTLASPENLLRDAQDVDRVRNAPKTPGNSHHGCADDHAPRNVRNSATNPAVAGRPSDDRPAIVNAVAMPGIITPNPPMLKIARECAFS